MNPVFIYVVLFVCGFALDFAIGTQVQDAVNAKINRDKKKVNGNRFSIRGY